MSIIQLPELLENYNLANVISLGLTIIQLPELLENYNNNTILVMAFLIIQLPELLENYNEIVLRYNSNELYNYLNC